MEKPKVEPDVEQEPPVVKVQAPDETFVWNSNGEGSYFPDDDSY